MAAKAEEQHEESLIAQPEDPARDQQDDVDHLEKMTNYKSCSKVTKAMNLKKSFFQGIDGHRPSDGKRKPAPTHDGVVRAGQVIFSYFHIFLQRLLYASLKGGTYLNF